MEIFPHCYQIASMVADRNLFQYLFVGDNTVLIDTGASYTPQEVILPFLQKLGLPPSRLTLAINTHADADHHGGNGNLKQAAPEVRLACGELDRKLIENVDLLFASRYNQWIEDHGIGLGLNPEASNWVRMMVGEPRRIDVTFVGGEHIAVDDDCGLQVLHAPGHSDGHLAFYDAKKKAVFVGDALHGNCCPDAAGKPSLPPAYYAVAAYLDTLRTIQELDIDWIYSGHWPVYHASMVADFMAECRRFVKRASSQVEKALERHPEGQTLREVMDVCAPMLGSWPENNRWLLMYPLHGHLTLLEQQGTIKRIKSAGHVRWALNG